MNKMRKILSNRIGMTLVEILVAIFLLGILTFVFVPFINNSFSGIILAGKLHKNLSESKSVLDEAIAKEDYFIASAYPLNFNDGSEYSVDGTLIADGELATFLAFDPIVNFESGIIQEGYSGDGGTFVESDTLSVQIIGQSIHLSAAGGFIGSEIIRFEDRNGTDVNTFNPNFDYSLVVNDSDNADIVIEAGEYGLDNAHSPYVVSIETKYGYFFTWRREVINLGIEISLPTFIGLGTNAVEEQSSNAEDWLGKTGRVSTSTFNGITWGNERFVAVGDGGNIYYLKDKQTWTKVTTTFTDNLEFIEYINGTFIAGGANGRLITSVDGLNWEIKTTGITDTITGIAYSAGNYIAICDESVNTYFHITGFISSNDLTTWSAISHPINTFYDGTDIEFDGNKFVAIGTLGSVVYSSDGGIIWKDTKIDSNILRHKNLKAIEINVADEIGIIVGDSGLIYTFDTSGTEMTTNSFDRRDGSPVIGREAFNDVIYSNGYYIAVGNNETVKYSLDGIDWFTKSAESDMSNSDIKCVAGRN